MQRRYRSTASCGHSSGTPRPTCRVAGPRAETPPCKYQPRLSGLARAGFLACAALISVLASRGLWTGRSILAQVRQAGELRCCVGIGRNTKDMWAHMGSRRPKRLLGGSPVMISASSTPKLRAACKAFRALPPGRSSAGQQQCTHTHSKNWPRLEHSCGSASKAGNGKAAPVNVDLIGTLHILIVKLAKTGTQLWQRKQGRPWQGCTCKCRPYWYTSHTHSETGQDWDTAVAAQARQAMARLHL